MYLLIRRVTPIDNKDQGINMYNRYLKCMRDFDDDEDFIEYVKILDDNGEVFDEY